METFTVWALMGVLLLGLELLKPGFFSASLGFGALAASVMANLEWGFSWEIGTFVFVSYLSFHYVRPLVKKSLDHEDYLAAPEEQIGKSGVIAEGTNGFGVAIVGIEDDNWSCIEEEGQLLRLNRKVKVIGYSGTVLFVRSVQE